MKEFLFLPVLLLLITTEIYGKRIPLQETEITKGRCQRLLEDGQCVDVPNPWYYDIAAGECRNSTEKECGGKGNRFRTENDCRNLCLDERENLNISGRSLRFQLAHSDRQMSGYDERCPQFCRDYCPGNDERCRLCRCDGHTQPPCPPPECPPDCDATEHIRDEDGCIICICKPHPTCPVTRCPDPCHPEPNHNGHRCPICRCPQNHGCNKPICPTHCEYGLKWGHGPNGCGVCECQMRDPCANVHCPTVCPHEPYNRCCGCHPGMIRPPCGSHNCIRHCQHGHVPPINRCRCPCRDRYQPIPHPIDPFIGCPNGHHCNRECEYGFKKASTGCPSCECNKYPVNTVCDPSICRNTCPFGCYSDSADCRNYKCLPESTMLLRSRGIQSRKISQRCNSISSTCRLHCPQGYEKDRNGCDICKCIQDGRDPSTDCSLNPRCTQFCEHGYQRGPDGCEICLCRHSNSDPVKR